MGYTAVDFWDYSGTAPLTENADGTGNRIRAINVTPGIIEKFREIRERVKWNYFNSPPTLSRWGEGHFLIDQKAKSRLVAHIAEAGNAQKNILIAFNDTSRPTSPVSGSVAIRTYIAGIRTVYRGRPNKANPQNPTVDAAEALYDLHLVDERWIMRNRPASSTANYNVANFSTTGSWDFYNGSLNGGVPYTWREIFNDLWAVADPWGRTPLLAADSDFPGGSAPSGTPVDIRAAYQQATAVLDSLAEMNGWFFVWSAHKPWSAGSDNVGPILTRIDSDEYATWSAERDEEWNFAGDTGVIDPAGNWSDPDLDVDVPGNIIVLFPITWDYGETDRTDVSTALDIVNFESKNPAASVKTTVLSDGRYDDNQTLVVYDTTWAIRQPDLPSNIYNSAALQTRANFIATQIWTSLTTQVPGRRIEFGIYRYTPNGVVHDLTWQITPDGAFTVVNAYEGMPRIRPFDFTRSGTQYVGGGSIQCIPVGTDRVMVFGQTPKNDWVTPPTTVCDPCSPAAPAGTNAGLDVFIYGTGGVL